MTSSKYADGASYAPELPSEEELARCIRDCGDGVDGTARAVLDLLRSRSATPTDEQLAEEAARLANELKSTIALRIDSFVDAYCRGARREGRR